MRNRQNSITTPYSWDTKAFDYVGSTLTDVSTGTSSAVALTSDITDDPGGGRNRMKSVIHISYVLGSFAPTRSVYNASNHTNDPNPRIRFDHYRGGVENVGHYPSLVDTFETYIPATKVTLDDYSDCVFKAYNKFVNGVRALNGSVSVAESGETPRLFAIWQRRKGIASNVTNGFLNYSFGWKPLIGDLVAIAKELRGFKQTVAKRLKRAGSGWTVRHFSFDMKASIEDLNVDHATDLSSSYSWARYSRTTSTVDKSRLVVVTIRAKVKPLLTGSGQDLLNKLGALGCIPSLATLWATTRFSFIVDWFYNIGGAIENLQGSLTHSISDIQICVSDRRTRSLEVRGEDINGPNSHLFAKEEQVGYKRFLAGIPILPQLHIPNRPMQYVLLGMLALTNTSRGQLVLRKLDEVLPKRLRAKIERQLRNLIPTKRREFLDALWHASPGFTRAKDARRFRFRI